MSRLVQTSHATYVSCAVVLCVLLAACKNDGYRDRLYGYSQPTPEPVSDAGHDAGAPDDASAPDDFACVPAVSSESLRARTSAMSRTPQGAPAGVFTRDLFGLFRSHCGGCHVDQGQGNFQVSLQTFSQTVNRDVLARIQSDDEEEYMPPAGSPGAKPFGERADGDPVRQLAELLEAWIEAGSPADVFYPSSAGSSGSRTYTMTREVGLAMTNLGNCIPGRDAFAKETDVSEELDAMFEEAEHLPERLDQTDLVSFDSEELARYGVVAFAPAYTLWADNAKKIRMVRVPRGKAIRFNEATQSFEIPPNTRFYKTFLKKVKDHRGVESYRKMETRLVVSRPDIEDGESYTPGALFGTYIWNEDETEAVLLRDPLRDGTEFRDRLVTYLTDEQAAEDVFASAPDNLQQALEEHGLTRTYAVPGRDRCIHCHRGAPNQSFVLGFTPLQLLRRPLDEGGVIEPAERDELNQLARLISYGVIENLASPDDVVLLEDSQGERKPRNEHELKAQGYMLGNCAHCHNPRGFPSKVAPEIRDLLNFWPSEEGGIFRFPLDRVSPRIKRGPKLDLEIPYISPTLHDRPGLVYEEKKQVTFTCGGGVNELGEQVLEQCNVPLPAPWRSLIYRNVDGPFTYAEDHAIFPHMPMDTPGYDCRARRLLGEWMVSVPVRFKYEDEVYDGKPVTERTDVTGTLPAWASDPSPFVEVREEDDGYPLAQLYAESRVREFRTSTRYHDCPSPDLDIVDPRIARGQAVAPEPTIGWPARDRTGAPELDDNGAPKTYYSLNAPVRPHWADTDLTEPSGDWVPRRADWKDALTGKLHAGPPPADPAEARAYAQQAQVIQMVQSLQITPEFREFALAQMPFGLWLPKSTCTYPGQKKVADFPAEGRPLWMRQQSDDDGYVYQTSPAAMVFTTICANCHGPEADSQGRMAATIADLTGGQTRVANLRDGLFGPADHHGTNIGRVFSELAGSAEAETWASRYLVWMGLGGTQRVIPPAVLSQVGNTPVLGVRRTGGDVYAINNAQDANMLTTARILCREFASETRRRFDPAHGRLDFGDPNSALIATNGDAEMWDRLCKLENPAAVTMVKVTFNAGVATSVYAFSDGLHMTYRRDRYPLGAPVGDPRVGVTAGVQAENPGPWCFVRGDAQHEQDMESYWHAHLGMTSEIPYCPEDTEGRETLEDRDRWALRGAMNAGLAVYLYLEALTQSAAAPPVAYDRCESLR